METLTATLTITEDMASDAGVLNAARFQWLIGAYGGLVSGQPEGGVLTPQSIVLRQGYWPCVGAEGRRGRRTYGSTMVWGTAEMI